MTQHITNAGISQLAIIDMQVKLSSAMPAEALQKAAKNCVILAQAANLLDVPTIATEQYPQGLGETLPEIKTHLSKAKIIEKTVFSACGEPKFSQLLHRDKPQIILAGMEAHICVLQTALDLVALGKQVFVVEDALISRSADNKANAIARLRQVGCVVTNTESVLFEWLGDAKHEAFKALSTLIR